MTLESELYSTPWEADEAGIVYRSVVPAPETASPLVATITALPRRPFNWRKLDTRMTWLTGGFVLFAACQLLWWIAEACFSGAFARAVAQ